MADIKEIKQVLWFDNETFGKVRGILYIDYGVESNGVFLCAVKESGQLKYFNTNQLKIENNFTLEENIG